MKPINLFRTGCQLPAGLQCPSHLCMLAFVAWEIHSLRCTRLPDDVVMKQPGAKIRAEGRW